MSESDPAGSRHQLIADYLGRVADRLPGGPARRRDVLDELEHGLCEAMRDHQRRGLAPEKAARAAITAFGSAELVAAAQSPEIRVRQVRSSAWWSLGLLVLGGIAWQAYHRTVGDLSFAIPDAEWNRQAFLALTTTMPIVPTAAQLAALALIVACAKANPVQRTGRAWIRGLTVALSAAMTLTFANAVAILPLLSPAMSPVHRWFVPAALLAVLALAFAQSLLTVHRSRTLPAHPS